MLVAAFAFRACVWSRAAFYWSHWGVSQSTNNSLTYNLPTLETVALVREIQVSHGAMVTALGRASLSRTSCLESGACVCVGRRRGGGGGFIGRCPEVPESPELHSWNMHKSYQPLKPATNKYLQKKWDQTRYEEHRNKVWDECVCVCLYLYVHTYICL